MSVRERHRVIYCSVHDGNVGAIWLLIETRSPISDSTGGIINHLHQCFTGRPCSGESGNRHMLKKKVLHHRQRAIFNRSVCNLSFVVVRSELVSMDGIERLNGNNCVSPLKKKKKVSWMWDICSAPAIKCELQVWSKFCNDRFGQFAVSLHLCACYVSTYVSRWPLCQRIKLL